MTFLCMQGVSCPTFTPLSDAPVNILDVIDYNGEKNPDHPLFKYEDGGEVTTISWKEAYRAFHAPAKFVEAQVKTSNGNIQELESGARPVIGILANLDSITFSLLIFGTMRAGYAPFLISTRNSDVAIAHLLRTTSSKYLFVSPDAVMQKLARSALDRMHEHAEFSEEQEIMILQTPTFEEVFVDVKEGRFEPFPRVASVDMDAPAFIVHSSGSTAFPKPIIYSYYVMSQNSLIPYYGDMDMCGLTMSIHALPMFHIMGAICTVWAARTGLVLGVFPPVQPPVMPTSDHVLASALASKCNAVFAVPSFLESWAKQPSLVEAMRTFEMICFGGGPLSQEVGDFLADKGVVIVPVYGITEVGCIMKSFVKPHPEGWQYWELFPLLEATFVPTDDNVFRLIVKETDAFRIVASNHTLDGKKAFDTNDLVYQHPRNSNLFCYVGRADDQIMHSTGEKTNPGPLESILQRDPKIKAALMFGRGKFQPGVLVTPSDEHAFDPSDSYRLAQYRNMIWGTVEVANAYAPQHSKIFKELILVTRPSKPFEYTAKGTPRRQVCVAAYSAEIEAAYQAFELSAQPGITPPSTWNIESIKAFIREVVKSAISASAVCDDENIFTMGADSLSATFIRNSIIRALRSSNSMSLPTVRSLPPDFAFNLPSVNMLSSFTWGLVLSSGGEGAGELEDESEEEFEWPKEMAQPGQTILQVRKGKGEPPLIVFHGGGGDVDPFVPLYEKFKTALWFVQVTPEVPLTSLAGHVEFYYQKIKELQPHGPYRLGAHSGSAIIILYLANMLYQNGDSVTQLAFLDYFPTIQFAPMIEMDSETFDITDPAMRWEYKKAALRSIIAMRQRQGAYRVQTAMAIGEAWEGRATSKYSAFIAQTANKYGDEILDFVARLPGYTAGSSLADKPGRRAMEVLEIWLKELPFGDGDMMTIYVAEDGVLPGMPEEVREEWKDLGIRRCFPGARVVNVAGGHETMLAQDDLIKDLQRGFI